MKFPENEDPSVERYEAALRRGMDKIVVVPRPCAACGQLMRTRVPFLLASTAQCRAEEDALEILDAEDWLVLCEDCAARFDLSTLRPAERHAAKVTKGSAAKEEMADNVVKLFNDPERDLLVYYSECARCRVLIPEMEIFTWFKLSRVVHVHKYFVEELAEIVSVEFCRECSEVLDFRKIMIWMRGKRVCQLFSFNCVFEDGWQKVQLRQRLL